MRIPLRMRHLRGAGEMNFAPTTRVETSADEGYADGKKSVSLADTIRILVSYPVHLVVYGVTSKSASSQTPLPWWVASWM
jgi:hypothetical protein